MKTFDANRQDQLAEQFHTLHHSDQPLILANAWNAFAAKQVERAGLPAVATTSSGISWSLGYADGEHTPPEMMIEKIRQIARVVEIPVSADAESGYHGDDLATFSGFIEEVITAGAVGINLEDSNPQTGELISITQHVNKIKAARKAADKMGVNLFINARVDGMVLSTTIDKKLSVILERTKAYEEAGASGIFVPFVEDINTVKTLKNEIQLPLNILMTSSLKVEDLKRLKINRISVGGKPFLAAQSRFKQIVNELKNSADWAALYTDELSHPEANDWFL